MMRLFDFRHLGEDMENSFSKQYHNPIDLIKSWWPDADISHIEYDPDMRKGEYQIVRQSGGDGTLSFTIDMLQKALLSLVNMQSFYKPKAPESWDGVRSIKYKIGPIKHATCFGMILLGCSKTHKYPGQRERIRIPVESYICT